MIRFILLQNRAGKTRLAKYYVPLDDGEKRNLEYEVHRLIAARDAKLTNFVEVGELMHAQHAMSGSLAGKSVPHLSGLFPCGFTHSCDQLTVFLFCCAVQDQQGHLQAVCGPLLQPVRGRHRQ